jgi:hypothetical protein
MTKQEALAHALSTLAAIEHHLDTRVEIWRVFINPDGSEESRIYRGSFHRPQPQGEHND